LEAKLGNWSSFLLAEEHWRENSEQSLGGIQVLIPSPSVGVYREAKRAKGDVDQTWEMRLTNNGVVESDNVR
jgi:hypothetical protein